LDLGLHGRGLSRSVAILAAVTTPADTIRAGLAAWSRGDLEGALENLDPHNFEFVTTGLFVGVSPVYRGHEGFRQFWRDFRESWEQISFEIERIVPGEPPFHAVLGHFEAKGREGIDVGREFAMVAAAMGTTVTRMQSYGTWEEAFDAAGVPPGDRS
jgi:ketosteroid isomerase-like protein